MWNFKVKSKIHESLKWEIYIIIDNRSEYKSEFEQLM